MPILVFLIVWVLDVSVATAHQGHEKGHETTIDEKSQTVFISKGGRSEINLSTLCQNINNTCDTNTIKIFVIPLEGVVIPRSNGSYLYQHGGTTTDNDIFSVQYRGIDNGKLQLFDVKIEIVAPTSSIELNTSSNSRVEHVGETIEIEYKISGTDYDHIHLSLNQETHVSLYSVVGTHKFENIPLGENIVTGVLANVDHTTIPSTYTEFRFVRAK